MAAAFDSVLVMGASGRVGRMLARAWAGMGFAPTLQHRGAALTLDLPQLCWEPGQALPSDRFSALIMLAGVVPGGRGDLQDNARIARASLAAAEAAGIAQVLLASSSAVYGSTGSGGFAETDPTRPINPYGEAKLAMEAEAIPFRARGLQVCALRIGNVAGADALLLNVATGQQLWLDQFADGAGPRRSYIGPQTMARVLAGLIKRDLPEVLNLAAPQPVAMADLAQAAGANWNWRPAPAAAHQAITLDCARLSRLHEFAAPDSTAAAMVAEWRAVGDRA